MEPPSKSSGQKLVVTLILRFVFLCFGSFFFTVVLFGSFVRSGFRTR